MRSEEQIARMLELFEKLLQSGSASEFTIRAVITILKIILEIDSEEDTTIMENMITKAEEVEVVE